MSGTAELFFFGLVFVLALTQLTGVLVPLPTWTGFAQVLVMISLIWWMYDGYAWLTSRGPPPGVVHPGVIEHHRGVGSGLLRR